MKLTGLVTSEKFDVIDACSAGGFQQYERAGTKRIEIRTERNGFFVLQLPDSHPFGAGDVVEITLSKKGS